MEDVGSIFSSVKALHCMMENLFGLDVNGVRVNDLSFIG